MIDGNYSRVRDIIWRSSTALAWLMTLASEFKMRPLVAHCHLGLVKLYWRTGKREQAQEHLTTATTMYREMGIRLWLEQAETELRQFA